MGAKTFAGWGFEVSVNNRTIVESRSPVEDFEIYTFTEENKNILFAYAGSNPGFPKFSERASDRKHGKIGNLDATCIEWSDAQGSHSRECLVDLANPLGFPKFVHFWYEDLNHELQDSADEIICSIKSKR